MVDAVDARRLRCFYADTPEERFDAWLTVPSSADEAALLDYGAQMLPFVSLVSFTTTALPRCIFSYTVQHGDCNMAGNLHGGCTATLFDVLTSLALVPIQRRGFWEFLGVSRSLNVTYLAPVTPGQKVTIECEVVSLGRRSCHVTAVMKRADDGKPVATATHDKVDTQRKKL